MNMYMFEFHQIAIALLAGDLEERCYPRYLKILLYTPINDVRIG